MSSTRIQNSIKAILFLAQVLFHVISISSSWSDFPISPEISPSENLPSRYRVEGEANGVPVG